MEFLGRAAEREGVPARPVPVEAPQGIPQVVLPRATQPAQGLKNGSEDDRL